MFRSFEKTSHIYSLEMVSKVGCYSLNDALLPLIIVIISGIGSVLVLLTFICKFHETDKKSISKDAKLIRVMALMALIMYSMSVIVFSISISSTNDCTFGFDLAPVGFILHFFAFTMVLLSFTVRIFKTFENTSFAINPKQIKFVYYILLPFAAIYIITANILRVTEVIPIRIVGFVALILVLLLAIYTIWLLRLFIKKLNNVIHDFIQKFGKVSSAHLAQLNKSVS